MHPPRCPYRGNASALRASRGVHNKLFSFQRRCHVTPQLFTRWACSGTCTTEHPPVLTKGRHGGQNTLVSKPWGSYRVYRWLWNKLYFTVFYKQMDDKLMKSLLNIDFHYRGNIARHPDVSTHSEKYGQRKVTVWTVFFYTDIKKPFSLIPQTLCYVVKYTYSSRFA